jgi:hypothetical protein
MVHIAAYATILLRLAGIAQICLALGSLNIPKALNWNANLAPLQLFYRQLFWTYAGYIFVFNLSFGLLSFFDYRELLGGTTLALLVCGFIALYWITRVSIQFFVFDRTNFPKGLWYTLGEITLVSVFIFLVIVYVIATYCNI